jgi:hypothetical protein
MIIPMKTLKTSLLLMVTLAAASVGPLMFPAAQAGYGTMAQFAKQFLLPAFAVLIVVAIQSWKSFRTIGRSIVWGGLAGAIATIGLEIVRFSGFKMGYMPGNLPRLMGVLLLDRFALGPSFVSDFAGWSYHFWNGASFGIIYVIILGTSRRWLGLLFGIVAGVGFLVSPVVLSLGVGYFGLQFSPGFTITVLAAHAVFGVLLGTLAHRFLSAQPSVLMTEFGIFRIFRGIKNENKRRETISPSRS